jgi:hypothetical protein
MIKAYNYGTIFVFLLGLCAFLPQLALCQDERFFRQIFSGELRDTKMKEQSEAPPKTYWYSAHTPYYQLDLTQDGIPERIVFLKKDNEDWLDIYDSVKKKIFSYRFENMGINSGLYRIEQKSLSSETDILLLYYYVGSTQAINTDSSAQLYLLTIDNKDLKTIHVIKGPSYFEERKSVRGHYHQRKYTVEVRSLQNSGKKDVIVKQRGMSEVLIYAGNGKWKTFLR